MQIYIFKQYDGVRTLYKTSNSLSVTVLFLNEIKETSCNWSWTDTIA